MTICSLIGVLCIHVQVILQKMMTGQEVGNMLKVKKMLKTK